MNIETYIASLFNDVQTSHLNQSIPVLTAQLSGANAVLYFHPGDKGLVLAGHQNASETFRRLYKPELSYVSTAIQTGQVVYISNIFDATSPSTVHDRNITLEFGYRSFIGIPITGKKSLLGLLLLFYTPAQEYTEERISDLNRWARFCSLALDLSGEDIQTKTQLPSSESSKSQLELLASSISHEINNSLDGMKNYLYLISSETPDKHPNKQYLKIIENEMEHTGDIVRQLSELYQPGKSTKTDVNINEIIKSSIQAVDHQTKENQYKFISNLDEKLPNIKGNHGQLKSVFVNLFLNAIQSLSENGQIKVTTAVSPDNPKDIIIKITDNGIGIEKENFDNIFEPFFTTKKEGTGLGLTICRQIVKFHRGTIAVESTPKKGTTFTITLPMSERRDV